MQDFFTTVICSFTFYLIDKHTGLRYGGCILGGTYRLSIVVERTQNSNSPFSSNPHLRNSFFYILNLVRT